ncbi:MAG: response regulator [Anaerolineales bacterium]|nr:response regulator [Anaerolineales bacterium]
MDASIQPKTVLIVDDDFMTRDLLRLMLRRINITIMEAVDGLDALEKIRHQRPDLVLLDAMMPHMDGFTVCKLLRNQPKTADLPVIMLTTRADQRAIQRGLQSEVTHYMIKPILPTDLLNVVQQTLEGVA